MNYPSLHRQSTTKKIQDIELHYIEPGSSQMGAIVEMVRLGLQDTILSPQEQANLTKDQIFQKCLESLSEIINESDPTIGHVKQTNSLAQILSGVENARLFHQLIKECFPEIAEPHLLNDPSKIEMFMVMFSQVVTNISQAAAAIKAMNFLNDN